MSNRPDPKSMPINKYHMQAKHVERRKRFIKMFDETKIDINEITKAVKSNHSQMEPNIEQLILNRCWTANRRLDTIMRELKLEGGK